MAEEEKEKSNIHSLVGRRPQDHNNKDTITLLKSWVKLAEDRGMTDIAIVGLSENKGAFYGHSTHGDEVAIIGMLEILKANLVSDFDAYTAEHLDEPEDD